MRQHLRRLLGVLLLFLGGWRQPPALALPAPLRSQLSDEEILDRLWQIVRREQIPVLVRSWVMWDQDPGPNYGESSAGQYDHATGIIWLAPKWQRSPWVLACWRTNSDTGISAGKDGESMPKRRRTLPGEISCCPC